MADSTSSPDSFSASTPFGLASGASIPRKVTRIPKDQQALLDCEDSWISALKRNPSQGTANVPPKVLEDVKYFHTSRTLPPPAQKPNALDSSRPTPIELAAPTAATPEQRNEGNFSSNPGTPVSTWSESPQRPSHTAEQYQAPSPAQSIKSQVVTERLPDALRFPSQSPLPDRQSSPPIPSSPPIQPAPKRHITPSVGFKRRPIEAFPSSSAGLEEELEMAIPGALFEATPPVNRMAARLVTASQAVTSPPCGQGSMVPSTYKDAKSPEKNGEGPNKKRRIMKSIKFDSSPQGQSAESRPSEKPSAQPTMPLSAPLRESLPTSPTSLIPSALPITVAQTSLGAPRVVQDTPGLVRTAANDLHVNTASRPGSPAPRPDRASEDTIVTGSNIVSGTRRVRPADGSLNQSTYDIRSQNAIRYLDKEWNAEGLDWLPPALNHFRSTLTCRSLETLQKVTELAIKNGTRLARLWSEPDGLLHRATLHQTNGKLVFPEELVHMTLDFFGMEVPRATYHRAKATEETPKGSSRPTSRHQTAPQVRAANLSLSEPPAAIQAPQQATASPQVVRDSHQQSIEISRPRRELTTKTFAQDPLGTFRNAYPSYSGSVGDFVKACLTIKDLRRKLLLPKWLYDDFIRAFVDGFIPYIESLDDDESPLSAYQWYVEYVDRPAFQDGIVTRENLQQVFKVYHSAFKSAKESLSEKTILHPELEEVAPLLEKTKAQLEEDPPATIAKTVELGPEALPGSPCDSGRTPAEPSFLSNQPLPAVEPGAMKGLVNGQRASTEVQHHIPLPTELYTPLANGDKGKRRMPIIEPQNLRDAPASAPAIQRHRDALPGDGDVTFVFSTPRPRTANPNGAGSSRDNDRVRDTHTLDATPTIATAQTVTCNPLSLERKDAPASKPRRDGVIAETPPRSSAVPAKTAAQHPAVRRSLPASFGSGPPSVSTPSVELRRGDTSKSTLSASTQGNRVKKPRNETEEERKKRKLKAKLEKMAREGRLAPPPSSMPHKS